MALFKKDNKKSDVKDTAKTDVKAESKKVTQSVSGLVVPKHLDRIIVRPRITEKGTMSAEFNKAYLFEVATDATKKDIALAIKEIYGVTPKKIRTVRIPSKKVFRRGKAGTISASKKAYVYLNKKDSIEFV